MVKYSLLAGHSSSCHVRHFHLLPLNPHQPQNSHLLVSICNCSQWNAIWCFLSWFQSSTLTSCMLWATNDTRAAVLALNGFSHRVLIEKLQCLVELNFCGLAFPTSSCRGTSSVMSGKGFFFFMLCLKPEAFAEIIKEALQLLFLRWCCLFRRIKAQ